ncbi:MAG: hypothetical protein ING09_08615 [Roseomonas sp.]|jgi:hypothetical protein|nr:hypothetical protein [Roseomonas sp.]MCA3290159.1 hypothetical protein [Roseomonas sp.]MCA3293149.1 hypothetical protein [Roseomonas sp.]
MALGRKRSRERRQRATRWLWRVSQTVMVLLVFLGFGILTYRGAEEMARAEVTALETRLAEATERESTAAVVQSRLAGELAEARTESSTWRARHEQEVPRPPFTDILALAAARLGAGIAPERLMEALRSTEMPRRCEGRPIIRRFAIRFGGSPTADEGTSFLDGLLRITATMPAGAEDVARLANLSVTSVWNGRTETLTGLPQRLPLTLGNLDMELSITASEMRGFAQAALTTCPRG